MRRRRRPDDSGVPERLARFAAAEWPDAGCPHEALRLWQEACADWLASDSERQPRPGADEGFNRWYLAGASRRALPFGEYGGALDVLREAGRLRGSFPPCPRGFRPAEWRVNGPPSEP